MLQRSSCVLCVPRHGATRTWTYEAVTAAAAFAFSSAGYRVYPLLRRLRSSLLVLRLFLLAGTFLPIIIMAFAMPGRS